MDPANYHCLVADAKIGIDTTKYSGMTQDELAKKLCIYDAPKENPLVVDDKTMLMLKGEDSTSGYQVAWWRWEIDGNDSNLFESPISGGAPSYIWTTIDYNTWKSRSNCINSSNFLTCEITFEIEDDIGETDQDKLYVRIIKPCKTFGAICSSNEECCSNSCVISICN